MSSYPTPNSPIDKNEPTPEPISEQLERLSSTIVTALNSRDFDFTSPSARDLVSHIAPAFKAELDSIPNQNRPRSWAEQKVAWKRRVEQHPDVHFEIVAMDSTVDEKAGKASVYMNMEVEGLGEGVRLHAMNQLEWRRETGDWWVCFHVIGMRGSMANTGGMG